MRATESQASSEIEILMPEREPSLGLIGIEHGYLAELGGGAAKTFLAEVTSSQRLMGFAVRRIELQRALKKWNRFFRSANFNVIHAHNHCGAEEVRPCSQTRGQVADREVVLEETLVGQA